MARIAGVNIPTNKRVEVALTYIFGIGRTSAVDICKKAGIDKLDGGPKGATVQFHNDKFISPQGLVEFIKKQNGLAKVKDNKLIIKRDWKKNSDKFKGAFAIARELAEVAASYEKNAATKT